MEQPVALQSEVIARLCRRYQAQLTEYLARLLGDAERANLLAQEAIRCFLSDAASSRRSFPRTRLFQIGTQFALAELRSRDNQRRSGIASEAGQPARTDQPPNCFRILERGSAEEVAERLALAIKGLPPKLRRVFVMAHVQGKSRADIALALGVSERRIEQRMTKALKVCRERLAAAGVDLALVHLLGLVIVLQGVAAGAGLR